MLKLVVLLSGVWMLLVNEVTWTNAGVGIVLAVLTIRLTQRDLLAEIALPSLPRLGRRIIDTVDLTAYVLVEMVRSSVRLLIMALSPQLRLRPAVVAVPIAVRSQAELALLSNMITLTPGTLSLDVTPDHSILYVHVAHVDDVDAFRRSVQQELNARIQEVFK